ncbi:unnamed protein product [Amaranthus hypochondriacus]
MDIDSFGLVSCFAMKTCGYRNASLILQSREFGSPSSFTLLFYFFHQIAKPIFVLNFHIMDYGDYVLRLKRLESQLREEFHFEAGCCWCAAFEPAAAAA